MVNSKLCSWEASKRDSRIPEKVVWVILKEGKVSCGLWSDQAPGKCLKMFEIQGSLKFNPFSQIIQFSSSKNINCFFINLKQFQTLPSGFEVDSWTRWPSAYRQISMFSTLHWHDALSQLSKDILKTYHQNLSGAFEIPSNSKKKVWSCSGQILQTWAYSNLKSPGSATSEILLGLSMFHKNLNLSNISYD